MVVVPKIAKEVAINQTLPFIYCYLTILRITQSHLTLMIIIVNYLNSLQYIRYLHANFMPGDIYVTRQFPD